MHISTLKALLNPRGMKEKHLVLAYPILLQDWERKEKSRHGKGKGMGLPPSLRAFYIHQTFCSLTFLMSAMGPLIMHYLSTLWFPNWTCLMLSYNFLFSNLSSLSYSDLPTGKVCILCSLLVTTMVSFSLNIILTKLWMLSKWLLGK